MNVSVLTTNEVSEMGEVLSFRRAKLTGFIPEDIGQTEFERQHEATRQEMAACIDHARLGKPSISSLYEPIIEMPSDCGPEIA